LSQSVETADRYIGRLQDRCDRIGDVPLGGRPRYDLVQGLRTVPFETSALIAYRVVGNDVEITNIFYAGEDYEAVLRGDRERGDG
jgi:toxin ParE1/3/4